MTHSSRYIYLLGFLLSLMLICADKLAAQSLAGDTAMILGPVGNMLRAEFTDDGTAIMTAGHDSLIRFWQASNGQQAPGLGIAVRECEHAQLGPAGGFMIYLQRAQVNPDQIYDTVVKFNWQERRRFWAIHARYATLSPDGTTMIAAAVDTDGRKRFWNVDLKTGALSRPFGSYNPNALLSMEISPNNQRLIYQTSDGEGALYDLTNGDTIATYRNGSGAYTGHFSPDSKLILFAGVKPMVIDPNTGDTVVRLNTPSNRVYDGAYSPDGKYIATLTIDWGVRIWDAASGKLLAFLGKQSSIGYSIKFSRDGKKLITASVDGKAFIWNVPQNLSDVPLASSPSSTARLYPDPAVQVVNVTYNVPHTSTVRIRMYDSRGISVVPEVEEFKEQGEYLTPIDVADLPSGVYFCEIRVGDERIVRPMRVEH